MYDYEYEDDVLGALRVLKYFQMRKPEQFKAKCRLYERLKPETLDELVWESTWELFDYAESDFEPDYEAETFIIADDLLNAFWEMIQNRAQTNREYSESACRNLFQDTLCYFLTATSNTVVRIDCFFIPSGIQVQLWMSNDIWDPFQLGNDIVTLLLYLEKTCAAKDKNTNRKEAA